MAGRLVPAGKLVPTQESSGLMNNIISALGSYVKEAQPAFKFGVQHPYELMTGTADKLPPEAFQDKPWADVYRESGGGVLPFAKSQVTAGQMIPQVIGEALDLGTRPSSYMAGPIAEKAGIMAAESPTTRGLLEKYTPNLAKNLLEKFPVKTQEVGVKTADKYVKQAGGDVLEGAQNFLADNVNWKHWGRRIGVPEADTETLMKYGGDEIEKVGTATRIIQTPQGPITQHIPDMVESDYNKGMSHIRKGISGFYDRVKLLNQEKISADEVSGIVSKIRDIQGRINDPESPMFKTIEQEIAKIKGLRPQAVRELGKTLNIEQIEKVLEDASFNKETSLDTLHNIAMKMDDQVTGSAWKNPASRSNEQQVAAEISGTIKDYISGKNPYYKMASNQWRNMKNIEAEIKEVGSKLKVNRNALKNQTDRDTIENALDRIDTYFKQRKMGQYAGKDRIDKYNAYNSWTKQELGSFREGRVADIAGQTLGAMGGAAIGGMAGGPVGLVGGGVLGRSVGRAGAIELIRPSTYWGIVKKIKPGGIAKGISEPTQISHAAELAKMFMGG